MGVDDERPPAAANASGPPPVVVDDPGPAGMAHISAALMEKAVSNAPQLARQIKGSVTLKATDYRAGVTIRFERERLGISGIPDDDACLVVEGEALVLARLGAGDHDLSMLRGGKVRVRGLARHPLFALRLRRLLVAGRQGS